MSLMERFECSEDSAHFVCPTSSSNANARINTDGVGSKYADSPVF